MLFLSLQHLRFTVYLITAFTLYCFSHYIYCFSHYIYCFSHYSIYSLLFLSLQHLPFTVSLITVFTFTVSLITTFTLYCFSHYSIYPLICCFSLYIIYPLLVLSLHHLPFAVSLITAFTLYCFSHCWMELTVTPIILPPSILIAALHDKQSASQPGNHASRCHCGVTASFTIRC